MNVNHIPEGRKTLKRADVENGSFSQVQQFTAAVLTHLAPCDKDLASLFAKDLYHLGKDKHIREIRSIFRDYSNQLLSRVYMSELVINEPHLLFSYFQVQFIQQSYKKFLDNPQLIQEAIKKSSARQIFTEITDITALGLYTLDLANEIGKYARYPFSDLRRAASGTFVKLFDQERTEYEEKAKLFQSLVEKNGSTLRYGPRLLPDRTKCCLKALYTGHCGLMINLDLVITYLTDYEMYYTT